MQVCMTGDLIQLVSEDSLEDAMIENVLGLRHDGDSCKLIRRDIHRGLDFPFGTPVTVVSLETETTTGSE